MKLINKFLIILNYLFLFSSSPLYIIGNLFILCKKKNNNETLFFIKCKYFTQFYFIFALKTTLHFTCVPQILKVQREQQKRRNVQQEIGCQFKQYTSY